MMHSASVALLFFLSGFSALIYEILWLRDFGFILGNSTYTMSVVLAAYMGGLALGSHFGGRLALKVANPLRAYGFAEIAVGLLGAVVYWLFQGGLKGLGGIGVVDNASFWPMAGRFAISFSVLLPPTFLMGLTLPMLARHFESRGASQGISLALLYAINTLGAAAGCFAAGFYFLRLHGMAYSTRAAVALNFAIGLAALALAKSGGAQAGAPLPGTGEEEKAKFSPYLGSLFFLSGFSCFAYEILYGRLLSYILGNRVYAGAALFTAFLIGISLGSLAVSTLLRRGVPELRIFSVAQVLIGLSGAAFVIWFPEFRAAFEAWEKALGLNSPWGFVWARFSEAFLLLFVPAFGFGAIFPAMVQALAKGGPWSHSLGRAYAINTLGCILGSLFTGFVLLPWLGAYKGMLAVAVASLLMGWRLFEEPARKYWGPALVLGLAVLVLAKGLSSERYPWPRPGLTRIFSHEDASTLVTVHSGPLGFYMYGDDSSLSFPIGGPTSAVQVQKVQAHLPLLLHKKPKTSLVVGLGFGVTVGSFTQHPDIERVDCIEILPGAIAAAPIFRQHNLDVANHPKARLIAADGRYFLRHHPRSYDLIGSNVTGTDMPGAASCYTKEFFELARAGLKEDGIFLVHTFGEDWKIVLKTLQEVFPEVWGFRAYSYTYFLVASEKPMKIDDKAINRFLMRAPKNYVQDAKDALIWNSRDLLKRRSFDTKGGRKITEKLKGPINTDDFPVLEYKFHEKNKNIFVGHI